MSKRIQLIAPAVIVAAVGVAIYVLLYRPAMKQPASHGIRYVPIGDSYTIGQGASASHSWPALLTEHLNKRGVDITLLINPAVPGWTTEQAIEVELPAFESARPTFGTLMIGVNDYVRGVDTATFRKNSVTLLNRMQKALPNKKHLVVLTIPDYTVTTAGALLGNSQKNSEGIAEFNSIIKEEASKRDLPIVDLFPVSQQMKHDKSLVAVDGLHPSAKEYARWEEIIFPTVYELLSK